MVHVSLARHPDFFTPERLLVRLHVGTCVMVEVYVTLVMCVCVCASMRHCACVCDGRGTCMMVEVYFTLVMCVCVLQVYMRIYQSEVLPEPKSMLEVDRVQFTVCCCLRDT